METKVNPCWRARVAAAWLKGAAIALCMGSTQSIYGCSVQNLVSSDPPSYISGSEEHVFRNQQQTVQLRDGISRCWRLGRTTQTGPICT